MLKVVVDTSVFVAGYLSRTGTGYAAQIIARWRAGDFQLVMSRQILEEIVAKFLEKGIDENRVLEFITVVGKIALNLPGNYFVYRLNDVDPDDNMLLAAAQEGAADYLVSLDKKHILPLKHHKGTQIVDPALFIRILDREQKEQALADSAEEQLDETDKERHERLLKQELEEVLREKGRVEVTESGD